MLNCGRRKTRPNTLKYGFMSVYTTLNKNDLSEFLKAFDVGAVHELRGISDGIENTNYFLTTLHNNDKHDFVLTLFESLEYKELPFFLNLMAFLAERKVPCAHPVARSEERRVGKEFGS